MKISFSWLKDFISLNNIEPKKIGNLLTLHTAEVENLSIIGGVFDHMVAGEIQSIERHPNADKLMICKVDTGKKTYQIICGATNIYVGMKAPFALPGALVRWHGEGDLVKLEKTKIRGVESEGMLCAKEEIGLTDFLPEEKEHEIVDLKSWNAKPGTPLEKIFSFQDTIFDIDNKSLTHRPDLWGHYGMARDLSVILKKKLKPLDIQKILKPKKEVEDNIKVTIKNTKQCPRYCAIVMRGIQIEESPLWLKQRLRAIGYRPINNIVDATNYVMAELGQPLHAFDIMAIEKEIIIRNAIQDEIFTTLDGKTHRLCEEMLVISDQKKALALAGIMGGISSEINNETKAILIESANFEPYSTRKTAQKLNLRTEAAMRFEKSLDPLLAETALKRIIKIIQKICPSSYISSHYIDEGQKGKKEIKITLNLKKLNSKIGKETPKNIVKDILKRLEFKISPKGKNAFVVNVPSHRATKDIKIEDDLVEEVARIYGYENIEPILPNLPIRLPMDNFERRMKHHIRKIFSYALGFDEVYNYSFYSKKDLNSSFLKEEEHIRVQNVLSEEQTHLRTSLLPSLLKNIKENFRYFNECKLYEIGRVYKELGNFMPEEKKHIMACIAIPTKNKKEVFFEAKGALLALLKLLKISYFIDTKLPAKEYAHPLKHLAVKSENQTIAEIFSVHPDVLKKYEINGEVGVIDIDFEIMTKLIKNVSVHYAQLPKFPESSIDISVVVPYHTLVAEIEKTIQSVDNTLISHIELFDIFTGGQIDEGKKALAFRITLRALDRTLKDEETTSVQHKIFEALKRKGGEIRGLK